MFCEEKNNQVYIRGEIKSMPIYSHEVYGEGFYEMDFSVERLSGQCDIVPVTISERLLSEVNVEIGEVLTIFGQFRSYNKLSSGKSKLVLTVFARNILENDFSKNPNVIALSGYICKPTIFRTTPFAREIADILVAVNRSFGKSDYIPAIAWGRNARFAQSLEVGSQLSVIGRIQSRQYTKKTETTEETRTAFEISISRIGEWELMERVVAEESANFAKKYTATKEDTIRIPLGD
ncbi:MAG: single-stranded DNA-binding protein [Bacillota bacterium]